MGLFTGGGFGLGLLVVVHGADQGGGTHFLQEVLDGFEFFGVQGRFELYPAIGPGGGFGPGSGARLIGLDIFQGHFPPGDFGTGDTGLDGIGEFGRVGYQLTGIHRVQAEQGLGGNDVYIAGGGIGFGGHGVTPIYGVKG